MQLLICTDLDRTILPNGSQPESNGARNRFAALTARPEVTLVYVTGRDRQLVRNAIARYGLTQPDYVVSDVGTTIYEINDASWQPWQEEITPDWAWLVQRDISKLLQDIPDLQPQEPEKRNRYKSSYYVPLCADTEALSHDIRQHLDTRDVRANPVWSMDEPRGLGLLDMLPARASKKQAVFFLMQRNGYALAASLPQQGFMPLPGNLFRSLQDKLHRLWMEADVVHANA